MGGEGDRVEGVFVGGVPDAHVVAPRLPHLLHGVVGRAVVDHDDMARPLAQTLHASQRILVGIVVDQANGGLYHSLSKYYA